MELLDKKETAIAAYQTFYADLAALEEGNAKLAFDYESKKGNAEARSHVHKLRQSKGALERTRKAEKSESLRIGKAIDTEAAALEARIEAMIKVHQDAIDATEKREADRIALIKGCMENLAAHGADAKSAAALAAEINNMEAFCIGDDYAEFKTEALGLKDRTLQSLRIKLSEMQKAEAEAAELKRLREEAAARAQADRDTAIAKAAEDRAKAEAERKAEQASAAAKKAIQDALDAARSEREAAERRELELKLAAENAERRRIEQEQRAEREKQEAIARAEQQAAAAVEQEKQRVARAKAAEEAEQTKREANRSHKAKINNAALAALVAGGMTDECAKQCIKLIASGAVPAVSISY